MIVGLLIAIYLAIVVNAIRIIQTEKKMTRCSLRGSPETIQ